MLGIEDAYVPHCNFTNCPVYVALGRCVERAVVKNGEITKAPIMYVNFTLDHRYLDGGKVKPL